MSDELKFENFLTLGRYFPMGAGGDTAVNCPPETATTDEVLAEISTFGGAQAQVGVEDTSIIDLGDSMAFWWRLASITFNLSANGSYLGVPWSFSFDIKYDGVPRPNKYGQASGSDRILNCQEHDVLDYRTLNSNPVEALVDNYTHLTPFSGGGEEPNFLLAEFFSVFDSITEFTTFPLTSSCLFIISSRNKGYEDVVLSGSAGGLYTELVGTKTIQAGVFGRNIQFYISLFVVNSNTFFAPSSFDVQFVDFEAWVLG